MTKTKNVRPRQFIAYKRTSKSQWHYAEYSDEAERAIDAIAPDGGYFKKLRLVALDDILPALRALEKIVKVSGSSTEHWHIANKALEPFREILEGK